MIVIADVDVDVDADADADARCRYCLVVLVGWCLQLLLFLMLAPDCWRYWWSLCLVESGPMLRCIWMFEYA